MVFWMQQAHELLFHRGHRNAYSQAINYLWQETHIYPNTKLILSQCTLDLAVGTQKGNHIFHCRININMLQRTFQQTQPTILEA
jgi:hypothetical protein